ncbi:MAG: homing endonuclease associated repeat-containing protein [Clostridium sp.]
MIGKNRDINYLEYRSFQDKGGIKKLFEKLCYTKEERKVLLNKLEIEDYDEMINEQILRHKKIYGEAPGSKEWDSFKYSPSRKSLEKIYGKSYMEIIEGLGFIPKNRKPNRYSDVELLDMLKEYANELESTPRIVDFNNKLNLPNGSIFKKRFGSYENALKKVGLSSNKYYEKEFLIREIFRFIKDFDKTPTTKEFESAKKYPSTKAYKRIFGSFNNCLIELKLL